MKKKRSKINQKELMETLGKNAQTIKALRYSVRTGFGFPPISIMERGTKIANSLREKMKNPKFLQGKPQATDRGTTQRPMNFGIKERLLNFKGFGLLQRQPPAPPELTAEERAMKEELVAQAKADSQEKSDADAKRRDEDNMERIRSSISITRENT